MDVILLSEIEDKLSELNSSLSSKIDSINTNTNTVNSNVSAIKTTVDNIYSKVDTEVASILTNTNTNNTASLTGTLSQKLSYIANSLIGAVNQTGGLYNSGTINAKLATIILNNCTSFVAGDNVVKYNPITSEMVRFVAAGTSTAESFKYDGNTHYISNKEGVYSFTANRNGTVKITHNNKQQYGGATFVISTSENMKSTSSYVATSSMGRNSTVTLTVDVKEGTKYYLDFIFSSTNYAVECTILKVSYDISTNTSLL